MSPFNGMLAHNMTQPLATATPFPFPPDPQWGPDDIGTIVFGCLASVLGVFTIWATFWLGRRGALRTGGNGVYIPTRECEELTYRFTDRWKSRDRDRT